MVYLRGPCTRCSSLEKHLSTDSLLDSLPHGLPYSPSVRYSRGSSPSSETTYSSMPPLVDIGSSDESETCCSSSDSSSETLPFDDPREVHPPAPHQVAPEPIDTALQLISSFGGDVAELDEFLRLEYSPFIIHQYALSVAEVFCRLTAEGIASVARHEVAYGLIIYARAVLSQAERYPGVPPGPVFDLAANKFNRLILARSSVELDHDYAGFLDYLDVLN